MIIIRIYVEILTSNESKLKNKSRLPFANLRREFRDRMKYNDRNLFTICNRLLFQSLNNKNGELIYRLCFVYFYR